MQLLKRRTGLVGGKNAVAKLPASFCTLALVLNEVLAALGWSLLKTLLRRFRADTSTPPFNVSLAGLGGVTAFFLAEFDDRVQLRALSFPPGLGATMRAAAL